MPLSRTTVLASKKKLRKEKSIARFFDLPEKLSPTLKFIIVYRKVAYRLIGFTLRDRFSQSIIIEIY
ncbi:MAG: hypothetical protein DRP91_09180, partial [Candidatus Neomarinimicrobiota bacterium]